MGTELLAGIVDGAAGRTVDPQVLRSRYRGTLLGLAAGNGVGLQVEGESASAVRRRFPDGIADVDEAERTRPWDDDLAQAMVLADALCDSEELELEALGDRLVVWARENGRGIGGLTKRVIAALAQGRSAHEAARDAWDEGGWSTAGNGAVMRCAPVALRWRTSGSDLVRAARTSALITHYDARCEWSTVVIDVIIAAALSGSPVDVDGLVHALRAVGGEGWAAKAIPEVVDYVRLADKGGLAALELEDPMDMGYTLKAMAVGLWCLWSDGDFEDLIVEVVSAGGDTDTNGAVAGAVMGAKAGEPAIPARWLERIASIEEVAVRADLLFDQASR